ncbi:MAG: hypothetical protein EOM07_04140 [Clostridia bacterium]|nr:hypothetical protein [Clostridia bacterium]
MSILLSTIPLLIILLFIFVIPIMIGVYVYRDASERGMNALLWTIVAVFVPSLLGLIIYLIFRENYSSLSCANCGERVRQEFMTCPSCGADLKERCPDCGMAVEPHYKVCPNCAKALDHYQDNPYRERTVKKGNRSLIAILAIAVLLPFIIVVVLGSLFYSVRTETIHEEFNVPQEEFFDFDA